MNAAAAREERLLRPVNARDVEWNVWLAFTATAKARGVHVGALLTQVLREWLHRQHSVKSALIDP